MKQQTPLLLNDPFIFNTRDLYAVTGYVGHYSLWMASVIKSLKLIEDVDFITRRVASPGRGRPSTDYYVDASTLQRMLVEYQWQRK